MYKVRSLVISLSSPTTSTTSCLKQDTELASCCIAERTKLIVAWNSLVYSTYTFLTLELRGPHGRPTGGWKKMTRGQGFRSPTYLMAADGGFMCGARKDWGRRESHVLSPPRPGEGGESDSVSDAAAT